MNNYFQRLNFHAFYLSRPARIYIKILNQEYKVFYVGTNNGRIYKIVQFIQNGESKSTLLDIFEVAQNEAIQVMQISQKRKSLYVSTDHRIKQIDLAMCSRRYDSCFRCVKDPYCGWDESTNSCKPYELGLLQVSFMTFVWKVKNEKHNSITSTSPSTCSGLAQNIPSHLLGLRFSLSGACRHKHTRENIN